MINPGFTGCDIFFLVDFHLLLNCLAEAINDENWDKFRPNDKDYLWKHIYATDIM